MQRMAQWASSTSTDCYISSEQFFFPRATNLPERIGTRSNYSSLTLSSLLFMRPASMTVACLLTMSGSSFPSWAHALRAVSLDTRDKLLSPGRHLNTSLSDLACRGCSALRAFPLSSSSMRVVKIVNIDRAETWPTCTTRRCGRNYSLAQVHFKVTGEAWPLLCVRMEWTRSAGIECRTPCGR